MQKKEFVSLEEKRAYYRLLRHLVSKKLQAAYKEDQARLLPPRIEGLLKTLEHRKSFKHALSRKKPLVVGLDRAVALAGALF